MRAVEDKGRNLNVIALAVGRFDAVSAEHHAGRGGERRAACVAKDFAGFDGGLFADNAGADVTYAITDVTVANVPDDIHH